MFKINPAIICTHLKYYYIYIAISAFLFTIGMNSQITFKTVGGVTLHGIFQRKVLLNAKILQQFDSISIIFTNYALENNKYGCKLTKFILFVIYYVKFCFGLFKG